MGVLVRMKGAFRIPFHTKGRHRTQVPAPQESNGGNTEGQALGGVEFFYGSGENMCGFFSEDGPEMCVCVGGDLWSNTEGQKDREEWHSHSSLLEHLPRPLPSGWSTVS